MDANYIENKNTLDESETCIYKFTLTINFLGYIETQIYRVLYILLLHLKSFTEYLFLRCKSKILLY